WKHFPRVIWTTGSSVSKSRNNHERLSVAGAPGAVAWVGRGEPSGDRLPARGAAVGASPAAPGGRRDAIPAGQQRGGGPSRRRAVPGGRAAGRRAGGAV